MADLRILNVQVVVNVVVVEVINCRTVEVERSKEVDARSGWEGARGES